MIRFLRVHSSACPAAAELGRSPKLIIYPHLNVATGSTFPGTGSCSTLNTLIGRMLNIGA